MKRPGFTPTVVKSSYALIPLEGVPATSFDGWMKCDFRVLATSALGTSYAQYLATLQHGGSAHGGADGCTWFFYVIAGSVSINETSLTTGGYAWVPSGSPFRVDNARDGATLLIFRIREPFRPQAGPLSITGHESAVRSAPFHGDSSVTVKALSPDMVTCGIDVGIFTLAPGAVLTHVPATGSEYGMFLLDGGGLFQIGDDWFGVVAGDTVWIAQGSQHRFLAAGPEPTRWVYYRRSKEVGPRV